MLLQYATLGYFMRSNDNFSDLDVTCYFIVYIAIIVLRKKTRCRLDRLESECSRV